MIKESYVKKHDSLRDKLLAVKMPKKQSVQICTAIGDEFGISITTVRNYLNGRVIDGYLGESILAMCKKLVNGKKEK